MIGTYTVELAELVSASIDGSPHGGARTVIDLSTSPLRHR